MVDSISSNMASPLLGQAGGEPVQARPEPAVQVTAAAEARNGGNATAQHGNGDSAAYAGPGARDEIFAEVNAAMQAWSTGMRFEIDEDTQELVVSVIDTESGEVLRQIPSDEVLHVAKMIAQFQGNIVSVKA